MILNFYQDQISDWATLSGDYNPIHFDSELARSFGQNDIVVHGMLPLLHIKEAISRKTVASDESEWITIKALFKEPIVRCIPHELILKEKNNRNRFKLSASQGETSGYDTIVGTYYLDTQVDIDNEAVDEFTIDPGLYAEKKAIFNTKYPEFDEAWLLLDAVTFSEFLSNEIPFSIVQKYSNELSGIHNQDELMSSALTVQTSHNISIEPSFFPKKISNSADPAKIICKLMQPIIVSSDENNLTGLCQFNVYVDDKLVMLSEIGLLIRINFNEQVR